MLESKPKTLTRVFIPPLRKNQLKGKEGFVSKKRKHWDSIEYIFIVRRERVIQFP